MPSPEELQEKRDHLAQLQKENAASAAAKDDEAAEARRQAESDRLDQEIAFAEQARDILAGQSGATNTPPDNTPPDNSTQKVPGVPEVNFGDDDENKEGE